MIQTALAQRNDPVSQAPRIDPLGSSNEQRNVGFLPLLADRARRSTLGFAGHLAAARAGRGRSLGLWLVGGGVVPAEVGVVAELARLDQVGGGEDATEEDAHAADGHVGDAEERVAAAHDGAGGDEN